MLTGFFFFFFFISACIYCYTTNQTSQTSLFLSCSNKRLVCVLSFPGSKANCCRHFFRRLFEAEKKSELTFYCRLTRRQASLFSLLNNRKKKTVSEGYPVERSAKNRSAWDSKSRPFWLSWVWCVPGWASSSRSSGWPPQGGKRRKAIPITPWACGRYVYHRVLISPQLLKPVGRTNSSRTKVVVVVGVVAAAAVVAVVK